MSLSGSLLNALSGLNAASRSVEVVASNVANAMTEGFARREISLASQDVGGAGAGVRIVGITRVTNERALADQREAIANHSDAAAQADAWARIAGAIGYPTEDGSLTDRINAFESALITAASRPDETTRLEAAVAAAGSVVEGIRAAASEVQQMRMDADADVASMIDHVNGTLQQVEMLNAQIYRMGNADQDVAALMDQRQSLIDSVSEIIPVRQVIRSGNQVALFTPGGGALIDGPAAVLSFTPHGTIVPEMTVENGLLSGLELNGVSLSLGPDYGMIGEGLLSAAFRVRDTIAPEAQASLDALARDLIERFQDPALDATIDASASGLFTDSGGAFDPLDEIGLANRLATNTAVDPDAGSAAWRLRDGLGATSPGNVGDATLLSALADRVTLQRTTVSGPSAGLARSLSALASDVLSAADANHLRLEETQTFHAARADVLAQEISEDGVNTDTEMQKLLLIEQVYSANAKVIQTVDDLLQQLLDL